MYLPTTNMTNCAVYLAPYFSAIDAIATCCGQLGGGYVVMMYVCFGRVGRQFFVNVLSCKQTQQRKGTTCIYIYIITLPETNSSPLFSPMVGRFFSFPFGSERLIFSGFYSLASFQGV